MDMFVLLCGEDPGCSPLLRIGQMLVCALLGVLFTQSGLDKVLDWEGNIGWLTEHFSKTPFRNVVKPMVGFLTLCELLTGALNLLGVVALLFFRSHVLGAIGVVFAGLTLLQLFTGQRIAKDYDGAAQIAPYFLIVLAGLALFAGNPELV